MAKALLTLEDAAGAWKTVSTFHVDRLEAVVEAAHVLARALGIDERGRDRARFCLIQPGGQREWIK